MPAVRFFSSAAPAAAIAVLLWGSAVMAPAAAWRGDPEYLIDSWETEDGLPENSATAMAQDSDGCLWFGTFVGLVRFDGAHFEAVSSPFRDTGVVNLHLDRSGRLWVSAFQGFAVRNPNGEWTKISESDGWPGGVARTFAERADGALLITTFEGRVVERAGDRFRVLPPPPGEKGAGYFGGVESGRWCVVQNRFIGTWTGSSWEPLVPPGELEGLRSEEVAMAPARDGGVWIQLKSELRKYRDGGVVQRVKGSGLPGGTWQMFEDSRGHVWLSSYRAGLSRVSPDGTVKHWDPAAGVALSRRFVFEDREGNLWAGSSGSGLQRFTPRRFQSFGPECGLTIRNVSSVAPDGNAMWVGTYGGGLFRLENGRAVPQPLPGVENVQSLLTDRAGRTWMGTMNQGLWLREKNEWREIPDEQAAGGNVTVLFEDSRGRIWLSGGGTVVMFKGAACHRFPPIHSVGCIAEDDTGSIWCGAYSGLYRIEGDKFVEIRDGDRPITDIVSLLGAPGGLWVSSMDDGLLRLKAGRFSRFAGAPSAFGMIRDGSGNLWLHTGKGVVRIHGADSDSPEIMKFSTADGLPSGEAANMRQPVCARGADGRLWFACLKGVASVDPERLHRNPVLPPVLFRKLVYRTYQERTETETVINEPFTPPVTLPAGSRRVEFHFSAPSLTAPEKMQFAMQLTEPGSAGASRWTDAGNRRVIEFFDLPPGDYTLRVRAANNDGVWNEAGGSLAFSVQPFFWQTLWFRALGGLVLAGTGGGLAWWLMRLRHARIAEKLAIQQQRAELAHLGRVASMSELSGSLAHELNQPLAAILSNAQAAQRFLAQTPPDLDEVRDILTDIVAEDRRAGEVIRRTRGMLKKGETVMEALHPADLVEEVLGMIRSDLVARNVTAATEFTPGLPAVQGDRIQLQQVILNLIINACDAMMHAVSGSRRLTIGTSTESGSVIVTVHDQGPGIPPDGAEKLFEPFYTTKAGGLGMGLAICRSILTSHGGRLTAENHPRGGAIFRMELPVHQPTAV